MSEDSDAEGKNFWILFKKLFLFSLRTQSILVALFNYSWTPDVTWTILTMYLPSFCALNVVVPLLSMEGQKSLGFHQKYLSFFFNCLHFQNFAHKFKNCTHTKCLRSLAKWSPAFQCHKYIWKANLCKHLCRDNKWCAFLLFECQVSEIVWKVKILCVSSWNKLICFPKMNKGLTGLERHEGE